MMTNLFLETNELDAHNVVPTLDPRITLKKPHLRLGHTNPKNIRRMFSMNLVKGINLDTSLEPKCDAMPCSGSEKGKMHCLIFPVERRKTDRIGECIHSDVNGPMSYSLAGA